jgi:hypothetical protein
MGTEPAGAYYIYSIYFCPKYKFFYMPSSTAVDKLAPKKYHPMAPYVTENGS